MLNKFRNRLFFFTLVIIFFCFKVTAENKIVYIDLNFLLQNSLAGKSLSSQIKNINTKNLAFFKDKETKLKSDESKILKQQNVLSKIEFDKLIDILSKDVGVRLPNVGWLKTEITQMKKFKFLSYLSLIRFLIFVKSNSSF